MFVWLKIADLLAEQQFGAFPNWEPPWICAPIHSTGQFTLLGLPGKYTT